MARSIALFDSWRGSYDDNPRAISERLGQTHPEVSRVWVLRDPSTAPDGVRAVRPFGAGHLWALLRARYVFANNAMPFWWRKPRRCFYVQTWHGPGAFKKVAWDIVGDEDSRYAKFLEKFARDVAKWDLLVTTNALATRLFPHAFRYDGRIVESGSPRSDLLLAALGSGRRDEVRHDLGLESSARAVLYAPTSRGEPGKDPEVADLVAALVAGLDEDDVLLLRAHPNDHVLASYAPVSHRVRNVSAADGLDVLLAADVLVTDYSSIFFDFALTGRPVLFVFEDLERYRDQVRGLYLDVESDLPGPSVRDMGELGATLRSLPAQVDHSAWLAEHLPHEDGHAADRVIAAVFDERTPPASRDRHVPGGPTAGPGSPTPR